MPGVSWRVQSGDTESITRRFVEIERDIRRLDEVAQQPLHTAIRFSASDANTVKWDAGHLYWHGGQSQSIDSGDTGNLGTGVHYIYYTGMGNLLATTQFWRMACKLNHIPLARVSVSATDYPNYPQVYVFGQARFAQEATVGFDKPLYFNDTSGVNRLRIGELSANQYNIQIKESDGTTGTYKPQGIDVNDFDIVGESGTINLQNDSITLRPTGSGERWVSISNAQGTASLAVQGDVTIGGNLNYGGALSQDVIIANTISSGYVSTTKLSATNISAGTIDGAWAQDFVVANTVSTGFLSATKVSVTNLSATNYAISGELVLNSLSSGYVEATNISAQYANITNTLYAGNVTITGNATISGNLDVDGDAEINGNISANTLNVTAGIYTSGLTVTGNISATSLNVTDTIYTENLSVNGTAEFWGLVQLEGATGIIRAYGGVGNVSETVEIDKDGIDVHNPTSVNSGTFVTEDKIAIKGWTKPQLDIAYQNTSTTLSILNTSGTGVGSVEVEGYLKAGGVIDLKELASDAVNPASGYIRLFGYDSGSWRGVKMVLDNGHKFRLAGEDY